MRTKQRFGADEVAVAVEAFVTADDRVIKRGARLRGDDPLVQRASHLFLADGSTDEEIGQARAGMMGFLNEPAPVDSHIQLPGELKPSNSHALVVTKDAAYTLEDGSLVVAKVGDLADDRAPWVMKARLQARGGFRRPSKQKIDDA